jgi:hypothetical protein
MFKIIMTMPHVLFGVWAIVAVVWTLVELLNVKEGNLKRIKVSSVLTTVFTWTSYVLGGWWYVVYYAADKAIIQKGPFPEAHSFFMEAKEHIFFIMLLLATLLPIIVFTNDLLVNKTAKKLAITVAVIIILFGFGMEGMGSLITKGIKAGLLGGM